MRGEYSVDRCVAAPPKELPPRARRIPIPACYAGVWEGTTSAHAENTSGNHHRGCPPGNYLRARGEYHSLAPMDSDTTELPPRTRRILFEYCVPVLFGGTTSAHAENTGMTFFPIHQPGNYLRARGEYRPEHMATVTSEELPPRTRRILLRIIMDEIIGGTTSAHAENTGRCLGWIPTPWNYLRARGEYPK